MRGPHLDQPRCARLPLLHRRQQLPRVDLPGRRRPCNHDPPAPAPLDFGSALPAVRGPARSARPRSGSACSTRPRLGLPAVRGPARSAQPRIGSACSTRPRLGPTRHLRPCPFCSASIRLGCSTRPRLDPAPLCAALPAPLSLGLDPARPAPLNLGSALPAVRRCPLCSASIRLGPLHSTSARPYPLCASKQTQPTTNATTTAHHPPPTAQATCASLTTRAPTAATLE